MDKDLYPRLSALRAAQESVGSQNTGIMQDFGTDFKRGVQSLPSALTGLADIPINLLGGDNYVSRGADYAGDLTGFNPDEWARRNQKEYSPARQEDIRAFDKAEGFKESASHLLRNPGHLLGTVVESVPSILAGGAIGRAVGLANKGLTVARGAAGEGSIAAGQQMSGLVEEGADPQSAALASLATGVVIGAVGGLGGSISQKMGLIDPDLLAAGVSRGITDKGLSLAARMAGGAGQEGAEEFVQSGAEQALSNLAMDRPIEEGLGKATAAGALAGGVLGGGLNIARTKTAPPPPEVVEETPAETPVVEAAEAPDFGTELQTFKGIGASKAAALLKATTEEEFAAAIEDTQLKRLEAELKQTEFYKSLQTPAEVQADEQEVSDTERLAAIEDTEEAYQAKVSKNTTKAEAFLAAQNAAPPTDDTVPEDAAKAVPSNATLGQLAASAPIRAEEGGEPSRLDAGSMRGLAAMISGASQSVANTLRATKVAKATRNVSGAYKNMKQALSAQGVIFGAQHKLLRNSSKEGKLILGELAQKKKLTLAEKKLRTLIEKGPSEQARGLFETLDSLNPNRMPSDKVRMQILETASKVATETGLPEIRQAVTNIMVQLAQKKIASKTKDKVLETQLRAIERELLSGEDGQDAASVQSLFRDFHKGAKEYYNLSREFGSQRSLYVTNKGQGTLRAQEGSSGTDIQKNPRALEVSQQVDLADRYGAELTAKAAELSEILQDLVGVFGEENLSIAMSLPKKDVEGTRKSSARTPTSGAESSEGKNWSELFSSFVDNGGAISPGITGNPIRYTNESNVTKNNVPSKSTLYTGDGQIARPAGQAPTRIEKVLDEVRTKAHLEGVLAGNKISKAEYNNNAKTRKRVDDAINAQIRAGKAPPIPPIMALLEYFNYRISPQTRGLANSLRSLFQQGDDATVAKRIGDIRAHVGILGNYINDVDLIVHNEAKGVDPATGKEVYGRFTPASEGQDATMEIWQDGASPAIILHEILHIATRGIADTYAGITPAVRKAIMAGNMDNPPLTKEQLLVMDDLSLMRTEMTSTYVEGSGGTHVDGIMQEISDPELGLSELMSYGLTDETFQKWMRRTPAPKNMIEGRKGKSWWHVFTAKLTALMKTHRGPEDVKGVTAKSIMDVFAEASGAALSEIFIASEKGNGIFTKNTAAVRSSNAVMNPSSSTQEREASYEDAAKARTVRNEELAKKRALNESGKQQAKAEDVALRQQQEAQRERTATELRVGRDEAAQEETYMNGAPNKNDSNMLDKLGRNIMNGASSVFFPKWQGDWEQGMSDMLENAGAGIRKLTEKDNWALQQVGRVLSTVVDQYGAPQSMQNGLHRLETRMQEVQAEVQLSFETLHTLGEDMQQGLLDYFTNHDKAALTKIVSDGTPEGAHRVQSAINLAEQAEGLLQQQRDLNLLDAKYDNFTVADFVNLEHSTGFNILLSPTIMQNVQPKNAKPNFKQSGYIRDENVRDKFGVIVQQAKDRRTMQFYTGLTSEGADIMIEVGADQSVWDKADAAPTPNERAWRLRSTSKKADEHTFFRHVTVSEAHKARKEKYGDSVFDGDARKRATAIGGLTQLVQEWAHNIEGHRTTDSLVALQSTLPEDQRYILDPQDMPKGGPSAYAEDDPRHIPAHRIHDLSRAELKASPEVMSRLRIPGMWAKLDDSDDMRRLFGAMAGKYVSGPVYMSMHDFYRTEPIIKSKTWRQTMLAWKLSKTVFSPIAHMNNVMGNFTLAYYHDIPPKNISLSFKLIMYEMGSDKFKAKHRLNAHETAQLREMKTAGITLSQSKTADFDVEAGEMWRDMVKSKIGDSKTLMGSFMAMEKVISGSATLYSNQDNVFRFAAYMTYLQNEATLNPEGISVVGQDVKLRASRFAKRAFVDYRIHAPAVRFARETLLPFAAWPYRMAPLMAKLLLTKPWKAATTFGAIYAANSIFYTMLGADGDDEEYERNLQPEWYQDGVSWLPWAPSNIRMPVGTGDNAYFLNLSRTIPLADLGAITGSGIPGVISPGGPAAILMNIMSNTDPFTGKDITSATADFSEFMQSRAAYAVKGFAPGIGLNLKKAYDNSQTVGPLGADKSPWVSLAKVMGLSMFQMNLPEARYSKDAQRKKLERDFSIAIGRAEREVLRNKHPDYDDMVETVMELEERKMQEVAELLGIEYDG